MKRLAAHTSECAEAAARAIRSAMGKGRTPGERHAAACMMSFRIQSELMTEMSRIMDADDAAKLMRHHVTVARARQQASERKGETG